MHVKIQTSQKDNNSGSSSDYVSYLEKENKHKPENEKEHFFSHERNDIKPFEVISEIDSNKKAKGKDQANFFSVTLSPSQDELKHIGKSEEKLKDFTRAAMNEYAANFDKGIEGKDLLYFAKLEQKRHNRGSDKEVRQGLKISGKEKNGDNRHIHVVVSRRAKGKGAKLSPENNSKGTKKTKGFYQQQFYDKVEKAFDKETDYKRGLEDTYQYKLAQKKLSKEEKIEAILNPKEKEINKVISSEKEHLIILKEEKLKEQEQKKGKGMDKGGGM
jgi:hypothetical protein